jgi:ATP-dependent DNA helicase UvrD/PcrA
MTAGFEPRPAQRRVLNYTGGKLGISAVPGSGKTHTLAALAAQLVLTAIGDGQEVLIVTLVNSAVDNFKLRISQAISGRHLLPNYGYRVRTLHGLAHDIVRERPGLVGLSEDFGIIDEREADAVRDGAVEAWLRAHPDAADTFLSADVEGGRAEWVKRKQWPALVREIVAAFIKQAKDLQLVPEVLLARLAQLPGLQGLPQPPTEPLLRMGAEIYGDYQRSLAYRGVVDFDDLIRLALEALRGDPDYLARLQGRWPFVLEDEAQDSSKVQEEILRLLVGSQGNWVRVGDPNQAIYETFTNADPRFLRAYLGEPGVTSVTLDESGRSQAAIIDLANYLVDWANEKHPTVLEAFLPQRILPTAPGDPQPNPPTDPAAVHLIDRDFTPEQELQVVADSLDRWCRAQSARSENERDTCAVLVPRNQRGFELATLLKQRAIPYVELLRSTSVTRQTAGALGNLLRCLADPASPRKLAMAFKVWRRDDRDDPEAEPRLEAVIKRLAACPAVEAYLWPRAGHDWLAALEPDLAGDEWAWLTGFRPSACRWHLAATVGVPIDQLILTLAGDLFHDPKELALAHKLALLLRDVAAAHPTDRLAELVEELAVIARNERRFLGFAEDESGFEPPRGEVTISTMHKAKGLEWDRVYLLSVNNYDFPSGQSHDTYIDEKWFVRGGLNLKAETLAQLPALAAAEWPASGGPAIEGEATEGARLGYIAERLRLLYVGITRARRELFITWNKGRASGKMQPAAPLIALQDYWQRRA